MHTGLPLRNVMSIFAAVAASLETGRPEAISVAPTIGLSRISERPENAACG